VAFAYKPMSIGHMDSSCACTRTWSYVTLRSRIALSQGSGLNLRISAPCDHLGVEKGHTIGVYSQLQGRSVRSVVFCDLCLLDLR
jgi:hypothetical protein